MAHLLGYIFGCVRAGDNVRVLPANGAWVLINKAGAFLIHESSEYTGGQYSILCHCPTHP